jgi:hypothetical protein
MRAAAISAGKPWNGWKARIRAPAAPKTKDQLQQIKNKDQTKQAFFTGVFTTVTYRLYLLQRAVCI